MNLRFGSAGGARPPREADADPSPTGAKALSRAVQAKLADESRSAARTREFVFTDADFEKIRKLIYQHAGISLAPVKQDMVYSRLARRLRARGDKTFADYLARLEKDGGEWETFVNSLTTNLTSFFRESHHFDILAEHLRKRSATKPLRIWCAAASTGEEPYSIAITVCEALQTTSPAVEIWASDIDTNVLAHGQQGVYALERIERMSKERVERFFLRGKGERQGFAKVRPELQKMIRFQRINLLEGNWGLQGPFDAIFCRNVMIYFDKPTQYQILQRFVPLLKADGLLFAGHSESFMHASDLLRSRGRTVYERADACRA